MTADAGVRDKRAYQARRREATSLGGRLGNGLLANQGSGGQLLQTRHRMNWLFVVKKRELPESRSQMVGVWSATREVGNSGRTEPQAECWVE